MSIKILIADDHQILRQGLRNLVKDDDNFDLIAELEDGRQALNSIIKLKPDIAVLDISMPSMNGLEIAREVQKRNIKVEIIVLTVHKSYEYFKEAMSLGVKGYVLKENTALDLATALKYVSEGKHFVSSLISEYLVDIKEETLPVKNLSASERRILQLISINKTNNEIGDELAISFKTVQNHRVNICRKLNLKGMNALLQFALENKSEL